MAQDDDLRELGEAVNCIVIQRAVVLFAEITHVLELTTRNAPPMVHVSKAAGFVTATQTRESYQCFHAQLL